MRNCAKFRPDRSTVAEIRPIFRFLKSFKKFKAKKFKFKVSGVLKVRNFNCHYGSEDQYA